MELCDSCAGEYKRLYEIAKAEGYKDGFHKGFQVFTEEIAALKAMRPIVIHITREAKHDAETRSM